MFLHKALVYLFVVCLVGCEATASVPAKKSSTDSSIGSRATDLIDDIDCPVGLVNGMTLNDEFGPGTAAITRCLEHRPIKVVFQINNACSNDPCTKPYALENIENAVKDYEVTHGLVSGIDFKVIAVVHGKGYPLVVNNDATNPYKEANPFQSQVEGLMAQGVKFYFCQNTARARGVVTENLIPGIRYVTSGVTALADFQALGYSYVQP